MQTQELVARAKAKKVGPVHVIVGPERLLVDRAVAALRQAAVGDGIPGFNDNVFQGKGLAAATVLGAARTVPMMSPMRFVLVRAADFMDAAALDALVDYIEAPAPSSCLVFTADKLDGRTRFAKTARKAGVWVDAEAPKGPAVRDFVRAEAEARGHRMDASAVATLIDAVGNDLSAIDDALERLSLYVGAGAPIQNDAVEACVMHVRVETIWTLVDAVSSRDKRRALGAVASLLGDREPPLRIVAMLARQLRMIAKMREALASGLGPQEAVKAAGAPPFKAHEMTQAARRFGFADLRAAFSAMARADRALKGSKRPPEAVLEQTVLELCAGSG